MKAKIFAGMILVLFAAGCVNFGGTQQASVDTTNIITLTPASISVIPKPPLDVNTKFTVTFEIKNQEKSKTIGADVNLFDWGVCKGVSLTCSKTQDETEKKSCHFDLVPQQTELVEIESKTPTKEEIAGIAASCPFQWRASYKFSTVSNAGFNAVSRGRLTELQRAGKEVDVPAITSNVGTGPVKPYITFKTDQNYVTASSPIQMVVQIKDQGDGSFSKVEASSLSIKVPKEWVRALNGVGIETACTDKFTLVNSESIDIEDSYPAIYRNDFKEIPLINRQTPEIVCNFQAPDLDGKNIPQKSYVVVAELSDYSYSIDGKQSVEIKP